MPVRPEWLAQVEEETLDPQQIICDPHHHLWDHPGSRYLLEDLLEDVSSGHNVVSTVFVECLSKYREDGGEALAPVGETEFVQSIADLSATGNFGATKVAATIVSYANLLLGDAVDEVLAAHVEASPDRFRGIRHACSWDVSEDVRNSHTNPPPQLYLHEEFRKGFARLKEFDLTFDTWLYQTQMSELMLMIRAFPYQLIGLDHLGGPLGIGPYKGRRKEIFQNWKQDISNLAQCDNLVIKLGGLAMAINGFEWHKQESPPNSRQLAEATRPYLLHCIEAFGPERCMFESNFPVDKVSCSYNVLWNSFKRVTAEFSVDEKNAMFHDTAVKFYSVKD
ncbi:MAG: amidohydrolase family protein [Gammaproteobacteria bacterium]|nr:amidohydrolase family protein [Gammaproteobacteria bacterium]